MPKRSNVTQRADGRWMGRAVIEGRRRTVYGATQKEADRKLRTLLSDSDKGIGPVAEQRTVSAHLDRWLEDVVRHRVRPRTLHSYTQLARLYIEPAIGATRLTKLQPADLQKLYGELIARGLSPSTVQRVHAVMRSSLRWALDTGLVHRNVSQAAHPPSTRPEEMHCLDRDQARALLASSRGGRWEALLTVALATGMRQGELLGLRWTEVDLDAGTVRVARQLGPDGKFSEPKTRQSRRTINLPPSTVEVLREHKTRQLQERLMQGPRWEDQGLVFCTYGGRPLGYRNVIRAFKSELERAGLPEIRFHDLRHTAATLMLTGRPLHEVSRILGHASIILTANTYRHVLPGEGAAAAAHMEGLLA